jgi:hypothetical protein
MSTVLAMATNTRLGDIGLIALVSSLGFFIGTANSWSPRFVVSDAQQKKCDPNAKDSEGNTPICQPPTPQQLAPQKSK